MNIEMKMLIKQLNSSTKSSMIEELKTTECDEKEIQELVNETIIELDNLTDKEITNIKVELLSIN